MRKLSYLTNTPDELTYSSDVYKEHISSNVSRIRNNLIIDRRNRTRARSLKERLTKLKFPGYERDNNKIRIRNINGRCCAYCGLRVKTSTPIVEHYRPKEALHFKTDEIKPHVEGNKLAHIRKNYGYFKWGDDHRNLFPSCACCNSGHGMDGVYISKKDGSRKVIDQGNIEYNVMFGKDNFFPIYHNNKNDQGEREDPRLKRLPDYHRASASLSNRSGIGAVWILE